ncbi:MAG: TPM domain-containing protein, partial [Acidobacteriota bacterium]
MTRHLALRVGTVARAGLIGLLAAGASLVGARDGRAQPPPMALTAPVNDFANVIDGPSKAAMERVIRDLLAATGDTIIVATVPTIVPYADAKELAIKMFENRGAGIGKKGKDNGLLVLLSIKERQVWVEVGYGLEGIITDGYAGSASRQVMAPSFKRGAFGEGLRAGVEYFALHIAEARGVSLGGVRRSTPVRQRRTSSSDGVPWAGIIILVVIYGGYRIFAWILSALTG